jgi:DNA primase
MPFIGDDQVRLVKSRIDLVQLMGEYTPLRKSGANFTGCCAFHQERTPSMYVYAEQQTYHCFGCGAHGDVITLIREKERLEFADAVEFLARRAGITIEYQHSGRNQMARGERDDLMKVVEFAAGFYERQLWEAPDAAEARDYLASRNLTQAACRRFRVGWSPGRGRLIEDARRNGFTVKALLATDLAVDRDGRAVDRFFERVMFPICDRFGHPVAFSGRLLPAAERKAKEEGRGVGKYVNNTDTPLYHKGATVFNLHRARTVSRDRGRLIVMEGPTDVMAADEAGYQECVAVLGTALTPDHAKQLGNLVGSAGKLIILLDGDRAGQANSIKAIRTCLQSGVPVRVATLPDELDPAELLGDPATREEGRQVMERVLGGARADIDHLLRTLAPRPYDLDNRAKLAATDQLLDAVRPMPDAELRALHLRDIADWLGIERLRLEKRLAGEAKPSAEAAGEGDVDGGSSVAALSPAQDLLLHVLVQRPDLRSPAADDHYLEANTFPPPWREIVSHLLLHQEADLHALSMLEVVQRHPELHAAVFRWSSTALELRVPTITDAAAALADTASGLRRTGLSERLQRIDFEVNEAVRAKDFARAGALSREKLELRQQLNDLRGMS